MRPIPSHVRIAPSKMSFPVPIAQEKLIVVMVGLPARGKSYITKKLSNYLQWLNIEGKIFNVGNKRRRNLEDEQNADFFNPYDEQNVRIRDQLAMDTLDEVLEYLSGPGQVGIFDATNSTTKRRHMVVDHIHSSAAAKGFTNYRILFLESICNDAAVIEDNILLKLNGPDYKEHDRAIALDDFKKRLENYSSAYETVTTQEFGLDNCCQFIKIIDIYKTECSPHLQGFLPVMLLNFLKHFNVKQKKIWISLSHIQFSDVTPMIGGDVFVFNSTPSASKRIPAALSVDQVHDLILEIENSHTDILIQTHDEFLIDGILKYFNLLDDCHPDLTKSLLCILPHHYSVGLQEYNVHEIPEMTRSNSTISNASSLITPREDLNWKTLSYQCLNLTELTSKLNDLPPAEAE